MLRGARWYALRVRAPIHSKVAIIIINDNISNGVVYIASLAIESWQTCAGSTSICPIVALGSIDTIAFSLWLSPSAILQYWYWGEVHCKQDRRILADNPDMTHWGRNCKNGNSRYHLREFLQKQHQCYFDPHFDSLTSITTHIITYTITWETGTTPLVLGTVWPPQEDCQLEHFTNNSLTFFKGVERSCSVQENNSRWRLNETESNIHVHSKTARIHQQSAIRIHGRIHNSGLIDNDISFIIIHKHFNGQVCEGDVQWDSQWLSNHNAWIDWNDVGAWFRWTWIARDFYRIEHKANWAETAGKEFMSVVVKDTWKWWSTHVMEWSSSHTNPRGEFLSITSGAEKFRIPASGWKSIAMNKDESWVKGQVSESRSRVL